tara:strand:+ start:272 stop:2032 length:1761 start_codon:yes stop_codon:yes gene_type:complete
MAEVLELEVKSNIGNVTKETKEYKKTLEQVNEEISLQTKFIIAQEKELIKLKAQQDAIPKGGWVAGMDKLNEKINKTTSELNLEKNALKGLRQEQKEATQEVKKNTKAHKEGNEESKDTIGNFNFMGVSLNGVKKGFRSAIPAAKAMFTTIKAGIVSTGIGALVIAVFALIQSFKRSEAGQEKFQRIMAAIGAITNQVMDAFAELGEIIIATFQDPMPALKSFGNGLLKFLKDPTGAARDMFVKATIAATDFVDATVAEIGAIEEVTKMRQKAHHIQRKLQVERAIANREINDIRLQAEDREKFNATERIALLRKAQAIEEGITAKEIKAKKLLIDAQVLDMAQGNNTIEVKDELARMQAELIDLDTKKLRSQRLLQTQITTAGNEEKAIKEAEFDAKIKANDEWNKEQQRVIKEVADAKKKAADDALKLEKKVADDALKLDKKVGSAKQATLEMGAAAAIKIAGEGSAIGKSVAVAMAIMNTKNAVTAALGATPYGPWNIAQAVATGVFGMTQVAGILSTPTPGGGGGGGGGGGAIAAPPAPQMMSGSFDMTGSAAPEPVKAFVLTDEMSNSQNQLANIRRRATI